MLGVTANPTSSTAPAPPSDRRGGRKRSGGRKGGAVAARSGRAVALRESAEGYQQHDPRSTTLYGLVADHLETFLDEVREHHERGLPGYVEQELRAYLGCGIHALGFSRARCRDCGREIVVAFSCQRRSVCPSCNARRMCGSAAHLTDHVFPNVPVRQWVLSVPYELRLTLARHPDALSAVGRIFVEEIFRYQSERAGLCGGIDRKHARSGAVQFPQRFGGSLNLNVHYHVAAADGVFVEDAVGRADEAQADEARDGNGIGPGVGNGAVQFHALPRPDRCTLDTIATNVQIRATRWLKRKGLLRDPTDDDAFHNDVPDRSALDSCLQGSLGLGELTELGPNASTTALGESSSDPEPELPRPSKSARRGGQARGFDVHAGVVIGSDDRQGRERLLRYCARPPLSLERLSVLPDGRVAYELRRPWGRQTHRVMDPLSFLARLAALVPPPRHPLIRFHGVFAPNSAWRSRVVPQRAPESAMDTSAECSCCGPDVGEKNYAVASDRVGSALIACVSATTNDVSSACGPVYAAAGTLCSVVSADAALSLCPSHQSTDVRRTRRPSARIDWAELLKRTYDVDALACPCGGRLRFISVITERDVARATLESLGLPSDVPPIARARSPDPIDPIPDYG